VSYAFGIEVQIFFFYAGEIVVQHGLDKSLFRFDIHSRSRLLTDEEKPKHQEQKHERQFFHRSLLLFGIWPK
jgi:hypothetical protein